MGSYSLFVFMSVLLILLPGPDTGLVTHSTVTRGKQGGLKTALGTCCGVLVHTLAAVLGLSAIIVKSAFLFSVFKYAGAVYLMYLGITAIWALRKKGAEAEGEGARGKKKLKHASSFRQGFLTNVMNPKVAVFFLTFLPQFLVPGKGVFAQFLLMGLTYTVLTMIWFVLYVYFIHSISSWLKKPSVERGIQGVTGFVLIGFGLKLAMEKAP